MLFNEKSKKILRLHLTRLRRGYVWLLSPLISLNGNVCFVLKLVTWNRNIFELKCFTTNDDDDDIDNDDVCVPCCSFSKRNVFQVRLQKYDCAKLQLSNIISEKEILKDLFHVIYFHLTWLVASWSDFKGPISYALHWFLDKNNRLLLSFG